MNYASLLLAIFIACSVLGAHKIIASRDHSAALHYTR